MILFLTFEGVLWPSGGSREQVAPGGHRFPVWASHLVDLLRAHPFVSVVVAGKESRGKSVIEAVNALSEPLGYFVIDSVWSLGDDCQRCAYHDSIHSEQAELTEYDAIKRWIRCAGSIEWVALASGNRAWSAEDQRGLVLTKGDEGLSDEAVKACLHERFGRSDIKSAPMTQGDHDWRSLDWHRILAARIRTKPQLIEVAAANLERWLVASSESSRPYLLRWQRVVVAGSEACIRLMTAEDEGATAMRQSSPFVGVLSPAERHRFRVAWARMRADVVRFAIRAPKFESLEELEAWRAVV